MITERDRYLIIDVKATPHSSKVSVIWEGDFLRVKLTAPPVEGKANNQLIEIISDTFAIPKKSISIEGGLSSKNKRVKIEGLSKEVFLKTIENK